MGSGESLLPTAPRTAGAAPGADAAGEVVSGDGGAYGTGDAVGRAGLGVALAGSGCDWCGAAGGGSAAAGETAVRVVAGIDHGRSFGKLRGGVLPGAQAGAA